MKSLNGYSPNQVKKKIAKTLGCSPSKIRLFGSRISGGWTEKSDLDCAIIDEGKAGLAEIGIGEYINYTKVYGMVVEYRWLHYFEGISWLRNSV